VVVHGTHATKARILDETDRRRLVRLCGRLAGSYDAAEDLAQETLLEAWRHLEKLEDPDGYWQWLAALARNVCLRWGRKQGREAARHQKPVGGLDSERDADEQITGDADLELELERQELVTFLDRALALLPPEARAVLMDRYVEDFPQSEIAARLRLSEGAVEARLHRGKLLLRKLLSTDLRPEAESLGLLLPDEPYWHATRIWCPFCARHYLLAHVDHAAGQLHYRCSGACTPTGTIIGGSPLSSSGDLKSPKAILARALLALHTHYEQAIAQDGERCGECGCVMPLERLTVHEARYPSGIRMVCPCCGTSDNASLWHLALDTPAAQRFWRRHPRMLALPYRAVEHEGKAAMLGGFESLDGAARLHVLFDADTYSLLHASGDPC
jgi:RNA polymerase sigma-70 factor (ECF subfamily)